MPRSLLEFQVVGVPDSPPLKVDRELGVIYGVKVLGRFSKNRYVAEAVNGTEYSEACMDDAVRRKLYEGVKVKTDHPGDRSKPGAERSVYESFGVLRNVRKDRDPKTGEPGLYADLHYIRPHQLAESVCDDVERKLGVYGLSHNAAADRERFDPRTKRLVIESLAVARSVDLVDKPATNTNLWESERPMPITIRSLLESRRAGLSKPRRKVLDRLVDLYEDDASMAVETSPAADASPEDALAGGFEAAMLAIIRGDGTAKDKAKKVAAYLSAHEKLTQADEPVEESEGDDDKPKPKDDAADKPKDKDKAESLKAENDALRLCLLEGVKPTAAQLKALTLLESEADRKELLAGFAKPAAAAAAPAKPRSVPAGAVKPAGTKDRVESDAADPAAAVDPTKALAALRG